jgi:hypothetical protein
MGEVFSLFLFIMIVIFMATYFEAKAKKEGWIEPASASSICITNGMTYVNDRGGICVDAEGRIYYPKALKAK